MDLFVSGPPGESHLRLAGWRGGGEGGRGGGGGEGEGGIAVTNELGADHARDTTIRGHNTQD